MHGWFGHRAKDQIPAQLAVPCWSAQGSDLLTKAWARASDEDKVPISAVEAVGCALSSCCWAVWSGDPLSTLPFAPSPAAAP